MVIATSVWLPTAIFIAACVVLLANALNRISNELKEANRLKRAELEKMGVSFQTK